MKKSLFALLSISLLICGLYTRAVAQSGMRSQSEDSKSEVVGYDQVREVIRRRCVTCHNPDEMRGDLNLASLDALLAGATSGPVVVAGKPNQSLLYKSAAHLEDPAMPPNSPRIPGRELDLLRRWIEGGLSQKNGMTPTKSIEAAASAGSKSSPTIEVSKSSNMVVGLAPVRALLRHTAIVALDTHPTQNIAAVAGNQQAVLLDMASGQWMGALDFPEGDVTALRFSRDGRRLVVAGGVGGLSGCVVAFDVTSGQRVFELADENDTILTLDLSPDGKLVALGGPAKVVRIYDIASGKVVHTLRKHTDWVLTVRFSPDGLLLASGDRFGGLFVWETGQGVEFQTLRGHVGPVHDLTWDANNETLISGGEDGRLRTWNMHDGASTNQWDGGVGAILSLSNRGSLIACGGRQNKLNTWQGPELKLRSASSADQIERIAISADAKSMLAGDAAGNLCLLDSGTLSVRQTIDLPVDESEMQLVFKRLEEVKSDFANRHTPTPSEPPVLVSPQTPVAAALLALKSEIESARQQSETLRATVMQLKNNAATVADVLATTTKAVQELQQAQTELKKQIETQESLIVAADERAASIERIYKNIVAPDQPIVIDNHARQ